MAKPSLDHSSNDKMKQHTFHNVPYFHGKITRDQAEILLHAKKLTEGLFLLRESVNQNYAISICHEGKVHHYNIEKQPDGLYRIPTGRTFSGPIELVQHHMLNLDGFLTLARHPLNRLAGESPIVIQGVRATDLEEKLCLKSMEMGLKGKSVEEALSGPMRDHIRYLVLKDLHFSQPWYHDTIRRRESERRLMASGTANGSFLVRYRKEDSVYVLSIMFEKEPRHYRIEQYLNRLSIEGGEYFETLIEMIDHYHFRQDGLLCKLRFFVEAPDFYPCKSDCNSVSSESLDNSSNFSQLKCTLKQSESPPSGHSEKNSVHSLPIKSPNSATTPKKTVCLKKSPTNDPTLSNDLICFNDWPNVNLLLANQAKIVLPNDSQNTSSLQLPGLVSDFLKSASGIELSDQATKVSQLFDSPTQLLTSNNKSGLMKSAGLPGTDCLTSSTNQVTGHCDDLKQNVNKETGCLKPQPILNLEMCTIPSNVETAINSEVSKTFSALFRPPSVSCQTMHQMANRKMYLLDNSKNNPIQPLESLNFPPIIDAPWEEPDCSDETLPLPPPPPPLPNNSTNPFLPGFEEAQKIYDSLPSSTFFLNSENLCLMNRLGGGNFGQVVRGIYRTPRGQDVSVAVKTLKESQIASTGEQSILSEAKLMGQLKHRHIVRLIGVCKAQRFMLILELAPLGPINKFLKKHPETPIAILTELMTQVAEGMAYLESSKFVHRDLAARNVLLVTQRFAKISDFGMSKALNYGNDYYRAASAGKWPLKWYAPECIYYFKFDSKSDVWSYGITLWEVFSFGERPYKDMKGAQILAMLDQGLRLSKPARCPQSVYIVMQQCWHFEGVHRPTFAELVLTMLRLFKSLHSNNLTNINSFSKTISSIDKISPNMVSSATTNLGKNGSNSGSNDMVFF